jgi:hypothetical protein
MTAVICFVVQSTNVNRFNYSQINRLIQVGNKQVDQNIQIQKHTPSLNI